jgi:hypothetical protein
MKNQFNKPTIFFLILGFSLIIYGSLCRVIGFNFFWESLFIGFELFLIAGITFLLHRIQLKKSKDKTIVSENIGIGFICFFVIIQIIIVEITTRTTMYAQTKTFLANDAELKTTIGTIQGFTLLPMGSIQMQNSYGNAVISLIVKGDKQFKDVTVYLAKAPNDLEWQVQGIDY